MKNHLCYQLPEKQREKFHSLVYSALCIAKRIKPECVVVISVLASRVQHATEQDWEKLEKLIKYINTNKDEPLCLEINPTYAIQVIANIDSSHATHGDYRGHTGVYILSYNESNNSFIYTTPTGFTYEFEPIDGLYAYLEPKLGTNLIANIDIVPSMNSFSSESDLKSLTNHRAS